MCKCRSMQSGEQLVHLNFRKVRGRKRTYMNTHTITYIYMYTHFLYINILCTYVPTCLPANLPTCQPATLPTYLPTHLPAYLRTCVPYMHRQWKDPTTQQYNNTTTQQYKNNTIPGYHDTHIYICTCICLRAENRTSKMQVFDVSHMGGFGGGWGV